MKLHAAIDPAMSRPLPKPIKNGSYRSKKVDSQTVPPPDEETLQRLNAIVKEYPFCIYYKQRNNDPL